ncbi:BLOC-1-related complex subunit 7 isoform X1 [Hetaerina americana]|uniref:BLOC-1-related complex subunit 7 isoform X1 n=1 Tax=Hetaerina americana TaxID=62018 RepID=UPI003A7F2E0C
MASASSTSARSLFVESKLRLSDRVQVNVNYVASVARQIQRGAKSNETLMHAAKSFALQENTIDNSLENLRKMNMIATHLSFQHESIQKSAQLLEEVKEEVRAMQSF